MVDASLERRKLENDLVLNIYSLPIGNLLIDCCRGLKSIVSFDHSFTNLNDQTNEFRAIFNCRSDDIDEETLSLYANRYHEIDFLSWFYRQREAMAFRSTDLISPDVIEKSRIHREWESRIDVFYTATACIAADDILYGTISLMRSKEHGDFADEEMAILEEVNQHLCNRFRLAFPNGVNRLMMDASIDPIAAKFSLTSREWEITCFLMQGYSRSSIAEKLCISVNALKKHVSNIYRKMNVNSTRQFFAELGRAEKESFLDEDSRRGGGSDSSSVVVRDRRGCCRRIAAGFVDCSRCAVAFSFGWVRLSDPSFVLDKGCFCNTLLSN